MLALINAMFTVILMVFFTVTGSLTDLDGFTWWSEMFWMSWGQLSGKAPKARDPDGDIWPTRAVRVFAAFAGMFAFSLIVGFVKKAIKGRLKNLKLGKGRVFESEFSMIIGWNDRMLPLVEQLCMANESGNGDVIVVMAPKSKPWMDGTFVDNIEDWMGSKIVTRKGDPINPSHLMKASAPYARSIVVLSQGDDADEADAQAARCTLALTGGMPWLDGHVVVELRDCDNAPVVRMGILGDYTPIEKMRKVLPLVGNDVTGRLMVQCSVEAGLAHVFSHILEFAGNEFYFSDGKEWMEQLYGQSFATIAFRFADAVCIGIKCGKPRDGPEGEAVHMILNPLGLDILEEGDSLIFVAEDDDTYSPFYPSGHMRMVDGVLTDVGGELADYNVLAGNCPDFEPPPKPPTKTLLVGWRRDIQDMVLELDKWVEEGSKLTMMCNFTEIFDDGIDGAKAELEDAYCICDFKPEKGGQGDLTNIEVDFQSTNPIFRRDLEKFDIPSYDSILVLTETVAGREGLSSDSRSMITMLLARDLQKEAVLKHNAVTWGYKKKSTESVLIAEILDPRTADLVALCRADDHMVSNAMISMCLGQMSEQPDVGLLIDDLFSCDGNEVHIKPIDCYVFIGKETDLSFWQILNRARQRGEVAIGYQRIEDLLNGEPEKGLVINPLNKEAKISWSPGDKIVVISED